MWGEMSMIDDKVLLSELRKRVNECLKEKEKLLKERGVPILAAHELEDMQKMTDTYKAAVERNAAVLDFIMDVKNEMLKIRLAKDRIDPSSMGNDLYRIATQQIDGFLRTLKEVLDIVKEEKEKLDRVVRFYERNYNSYVV